MAKQLTPTARPAVGPQHVCVCESLCRYVSFSRTVGAVAVFVIAADSIDYTEENLVKQLEQFIHQKDKLAVCSQGKDRILSIK